MLKYIYPFLQRYTSGLKSFYVSFSVQKSDSVLVTSQGDITLIGINRPEKRNCVNYETANQLRNAFHHYAENENARVAVLYGVGGNFCAGYDLKEVASGQIPDVKFDEGPMGPTKLALKKPVIAAIDGYAVAGGMELALWCDIRVMEESAFMGILCRRFGVPLIDGGTVRLPKLIGLARALDLILTGRKIDAREANEIGLITKLCKTGEALPAAIELANILCRNSENCIETDRRKLNTFHDFHSLENRV